MKIMTTAHTNSPSKGLLLLGGALSILVGFFAIGAPALFSYVITAFIGALCLVSGLIGLFQSLFGKETPHRILSAFSAVIRLAAGAALFFFTGSGMAALTLILAVVFGVEGVFCIITSIRMRDNKAWVWLLLNGIAALVLGGMVFNRWPFDADWVIGVLYGIQSLFSGTAMLMLGLSAPKPAK
jgi:uncharacterized membrane protein HdeD (DUF308 family)